MCAQVLVYIPNRLYSKGPLFPYFLNSAKLHQKILAQHFVIPVLLCFITLCKTSLILTLVWILLGSYLCPIYLKTVENHWTFLSFLELCKTETFFTCFYLCNKQNSLSCHIMFLALSFSVYYKAVSISKQIKR